MYHKVLNNKNQHPTWVKNVLTKVVNLCAEGILIYSSENPWLTSVKIKHVIVAIFYSCTANLVWEKQCRTLRRVIVRLMQQIKV